MRKVNLARLLARRTEGIFVAPFEQGEIGPDLFRHACKFGLEGMARSGAIVPISAGGRDTGSRSRIPTIRPIAGCRTSFSTGRNRNSFSSMGMQ
jgi:hypothetical protein